MTGKKRTTKQQLTVVLPREPLWKLEFGACSSRLACGCDAITMVTAGRAGSGEPSVFLFAWSSWHVGSGQRRGLCGERVTFYLGEDGPLGLRSGAIRDGRAAGRRPCRRGAGYSHPQSRPLVPGLPTPPSTRFLGTGNQSFQDKCGGVPARDTDAGHLSFTSQNS